MNESAQPLEARLLAWREIDRAARDAETAVAAMGQGAADPSARDLFVRAQQLRDDADREFGAIMRAVKSGGPGP